MGYKEDFVEHYTKNISREGSKELLEWLEKSDFFVAPASTKYHGNYEGGLCEHSLNVFYRLTMLCETLDEFSDISMETIAICGLLHDVTKVNCYKPGFRNVKNEDGVWEKVPSYDFDERFMYGGHGGKSVFLIERFMKLELEEAVAIYNHMGAFDITNVTPLSNAFEQRPFALLVHMADCMATYIDENKSFNAKEKEEEIEK